MNYFDYYQVITLIVFLLVFFGRTIWLRKKGTKVFVLGSGKKGFTALLEKSFLIFFPIWLIEIGIHSLHLNIQFLPLVMVKLFFKNQIIQFAGAVVIFVGLLVFCLALISFSSSLSFKAWATATAVVLESNKIDSIGLIKVAANSPILRFLPALRLFRV